MKLDTPLKNGYTGKLSTQNKDSLLAALVQYVAVAQYQGIKPTRVGFAALRRSLKPKTYGRTVLRLAVALGVIEITSERLGLQGKVLKLGPKAGMIQTRLGVLNNKTI